MKYKTTDKEQRANNCLIIAFGYCQIQNIEKYLTPNAYTCGVYGWRADFYEFSGFTISTGYAPLDFYRGEYNKKRGEYIKKEIKKLEKNLEQKKYNWQSGGDWHKESERVYKMIEKIAEKANKTITE